MSTVDSTQVEKIVSLLQGNEAYQIQALELLVAFDNPDLLQVVREQIQPEITIVDHEMYFNIVGPTSSIRIPNDRNEDWLTLGLFKETDVRHIFMTDIDVVELEKLIHQHPHLITLKVKSSENYWSWRGGVSLDSLPDNIGTLKDLKNLYIENHWHLSTLPESMSNLTQLEKVSFARTGLTCLPSWLMQCENLTMLNINGMDKLKAIHPALMTHPSLKTIYAHQNSRYGTVNPALPNTPTTMNVYKADAYIMTPRMSKHEAKWRQQMYFRKRYNQK